MELLPEGAVVFLGGGAEQLFSEKGNEVEKERKSIFKQFTRKLQTLATRA